MSHPISDMMGTTMEKIRSLVDVNTVVGEPITTPDGVTIIPVSRVNFGFGSGGSDYITKTAAASGQTPFGGGGGAGVTIQPVCFLVVKGESVRMLPVAEPASSSLDRIIELMPELIDKISDYLKKKKEEKAEEKDGEKADAETD